MIKKSTLPGDAKPGTAKPGTAKPGSAKPGAAKWQRETPPPAGPAPTEARLRDAALAHLARFATTEAGLLRVLQRRVDRWAQRAAAEAVNTAPDAAAEATARIAPAAAATKQAAALVARGLLASGVVDDAAFAASRARRLSRAGRSRRAIAANLAGKGVQRDATAAALPTDDATELDAALAYCRRRRIGPFAVPGRVATPRVIKPRADKPRAAKPASRPQRGMPPPSPEAEARRKSLAAMARAGFDQATAEAALDFAPAAAAQRLAESWRG